MKTARKNKSDEEFAKKELARQKYIIMNSFYGTFGAELFITLNKRTNQENLPVKKLEINEICKKE